VSHRPMVQGLRGHAYGKPVVDDCGPISPGMRDAALPGADAAREAPTVVAALGPRMMACHPNSPMVRTRTTRRRSIPRRLARSSGPGSCCARKSGFCWRPTGRGAACRA